MSFGTRFLKSLTQNWWVLYWIATIILFFTAPQIGVQWGILSVVLFVVIVVFIFFMKRRKKASILRNLLGIEKIGEKDLARLAGVYIEEAHAFLHDVSRNPEASGIPILVKGEYIYFSNETIKKFKKLYKEGKNTKELIEEMPQFETREEVKKMLEKLKEFDELPARKKEGDDGQASSASVDEEDTDSTREQKVKKPLSKGVHPVIGVITAFVAVIFLVVACVSLNNGTVDIVSNPASYHPWLEEISNATGYSLLIFAVALVLSFASRRKGMVIALCASIVFAFSIVMYINYFRPYMNVIPAVGAEAILQAFKSLVGTLEALAIIPTLLGVVVELNHLRQPTR